MRSESTVQQAFPREHDETGGFRRQRSAFRDRVSAKASSDYPAAAGRYHLYVSYACPWASRALIVRRLKGLEDAIGATVVDPIRDERGWAFRDVPGAQLDPLNGWDYLSQAYAATDPGFEGRVTVPVMWDSERRRVVNNESADIVRMLNSEFDAYAADPELDLYPEPLRAEIDTLNERIYDTVNNGVYKAGFATTQAAYEHAVVPLFETLDWLDERLASRRYLTGERITEADWRLFVTLVRFDPVYVGHFKCNLRRLVDYPNLWPYARELYQWPGMRELVDFDHIKRHYYMTHAALNPAGVVPLGPLIDWDEPHGRGDLDATRETAGQPARPYPPPAS